MAIARTADADDLDELLDLYRSLNPDDPELAGEDAAEQWEAMLADEWLDVVVIERDGKLVATCLLSVTPNLTPCARPFAVIENVVTREDYRGRGFGKRVLEKARALAEARDCYEIMLLTGTEQEWKLEFYEDCGFERERKTAFEMDLR